jgi:ADP-heptose:LPS heptosyltransferase
LLGSETDAATAREVEDSCGRDIANLVGRTSLREAVGIIARAKVAVGPDTGLMHIAAAVSTPVISLWGATSPSRSGPYGFEELAIQGKADCSPCYLKRCPIGRVCMQSIDVEAIMTKIETALSRERKGISAYETRS